MKRKPWLLAHIQRKHDEAKKNPASLLAFYKSNLFIKSPTWRGLRKQILDSYPKICMRCGTKEMLSVDHILPRSIRPDLALSPDNMQILCMRCNRLKHLSVEDFRPRLLEQSKKTLDLDLKCSDMP